MAFDYKYAPSYGIERYKDNGGDGGAEVSNDNLLITLWRLEDKEDFEAAVLLVPSYADPTVPAAEQAAYEQAAKSRDSARFFAQLAGLTPPPSNLLAVLNPSQEYRQKLVDAVVYNGGPTGLLSSYTIKKSLQVNYLWEVEGVASTTALGGNIYTTAAMPQTLFSTYLDVPYPPPGPSAVPLAFLKTNGADGVAPVLFDRSTSDGVKEMIAAVNRGDFYVAMILDATSPLGAGYVTIKYPHSVARG